MVTKLKEALGVLLFRLIDSIPTKKRLDRGEVCMVDQDIDYLNRLIAFLMDKKSNASCGDWLSNDEEMFYQACIDEIHFFVEGLKND